MKQVWGAKGQRALLYRDSLSHIGWQGKQLPFESWASLVTRLIRAIPADPAKLPDVSPFTNLKTFWADNQTLENEMDLIVRCKITLDMPAHDAGEINLRIVAFRGNEIRAL